jgi:hypothetical protein
VPDGTYSALTITSVIGYEDYDRRNYRLAASSPFKGFATDGSDPGADMNVIEWSTEGVISGIENPYLDTWITEITPANTSAVICYTAYDVAPASVTVAATRRYAPDVGTDTREQTGRRGCITVAGLEPGTRYFARLETAGRYRDTFADGRFAEFRTRGST